LTALSLLLLLLLQRVPGHTRMFSREVVNSNAKRQAAGAKYIDNTEMCESDFEPNPLQASRDFSGSYFCSFITTK